MEGYCKIRFLCLGYNPPDASIWLPPNFDATLRDLFIDALVSLIFEGCIGVKLKVKHSMIKPSEA